MIVAVELRLQTGQEFTEWLETRGRSWVAGRQGVFLFCFLVRELCKWRSGVVGLEAPQ